MVAAMYVTRSNSGGKERALRLSARIFYLLLVLSLAVFAHYVLGYLYHAVYAKLRSTDGFATNPEESQVSDTQTAEAVSGLWSSSLSLGGFGLDEVLVSLMLVGCVLRHWPDLLDPNNLPPRCKAFCARLMADYEVGSLTDVTGDNSPKAVNESARPDDEISPPQVPQQARQQQEPLESEGRADKATEVCTELLDVPVESLLSPEGKQTSATPYSRKILLPKYGSQVAMSKCLKRYKTKADHMRHVTKSKQLMLGALCVQRRSLASDLATLTDLVRTSRCHLDNQQEANRSLVLKIEKLCGAGCASGSSANDVHNRLGGFNGTTDDFRQ